MFRQDKGEKSGRTAYFSFCFSLELCFLTMRPHSLYLLCLWAMLYFLLSFDHLLKHLLSHHSQVWAPFIWLYGTDTNTWPECCWMQVLISTWWSVPVVHWLTSCYTIAYSVLHLPSVCLLHFPHVVLFLLPRMSKVAKVLSCMRLRAVMPTWLTSSLR